MRAATAQVHHDYWHLLFVHSWAAQSPLLLHALPLEQVGEHAGAAQSPAVQTFEPQSSFEPQGAPSAWALADPLDAVCRKTVTPNGARKSVGALRRARHAAAGRDRLRAILNVESA